jgi:hypothetical protein
MAIVLSFGKNQKEKHEIAGNVGHGHKGRDDTRFLPFELHCSDLELCNAFIPNPQCNALTPNPLSLGERGLGVRAN